MSNDYFDDVVGKAYRLYEERLAAANAIDFGDLLLSVLKLCSSGTPAAEEIAQRFDHVLVDEFQDTNSVQYRLVRLLSRRTNSITVVGDDDQSIYRWRGADIRNILDFEGDHPGARVVKLEQNYRSTGNILAAANAIIEKNTERRPKRLFTEEGGGRPDRPVRGRDGARRGGVRRQPSSPMRCRRRWPRATSRSSIGPTPSRASWKRRCARGICPTRWSAARASSIAPRSRTSSRTCAWWRTPTTGSALQRIINVPARGIGDTTVEKIGDIICATERSAPGRRWSWWRG